MKFVIQFDSPVEPNCRASGQQEAVVAIAELMAAFRDVEQMRPGFCDELIKKFVSFVQSCPPSRPPSAKTST